MGSYQVLSFVVSFQRLPQRSFFRVAHLGSPICLCHALKWDRFLKGPVSMLTHLSGRTCGVGYT